MAIEIGNNWPVMAITLPKENPLQKKSTTDLSSQNSRDSVILDDRTGPESNAFLEKGTFIDFYI